jgi:hypothetical protein
MKLTDFVAMHVVLRSATRTALARPSVPAGLSLRLAPRSELASLGQARSFASRKNKKKGTQSTSTPSEASTPSPAASDTAPASEAAHASDASSNAQSISQEPTSTVETAAPSPFVTPAPAQTLSLDFAPPGPNEQPEEGGRTGARSSKDSLSSIEKRQKRMARLGMAALGLGAIAGVVYMGRDWEPEELTERRLVRGPFIITRFFS